MTTTRNGGLVPSPSEEDRQAVLTTALTPPAGGLAPQTIGQALEWARILCQSSLVPEPMQGNPADVLVAILWGARLGMDPVVSLQNIAVINGRATLWGDAHLAIVLSRARAELETFEERWDPDTDGGTWTTIVQRRGFPPVVRSFSVGEARRIRVLTRAGAMALADKESWRNYPRRMCKFKARAEALRDAFPDVLQNIATREDAEEWIEAETTARASTTVEDLLARLDPTLADRLTRAFDTLALSRAERLIKLRQFHGREAELLQDLREEFALVRSRGAAHAPRSVAPTLAPAAPPGPSAEPSTPPPDEEEPEAAVRLGPADAEELMF